MLGRDISYTQDGKDASFFTSLDHSLGLDIASERKSKERLFRYASYKAQSVEDTGCRLCAQKPRVLITREGYFVHHLHVFS